MQGVRRPDKPRWLNALEVVLLAYQAAALQVTAKTVYYC